MFKHTACALAITGMLAACANDPNNLRSAGAGAAVGAGVGAIAGALIGKRKGALIGAGVGAIAGAGVGTYLGQQQRELERNLEGTGATVTNTGEELLVNLPSEITFAFDKSDIQPQFRDSLARVATTLQDYESSLIDVVGHTDNVGSDAYNMELSQRRANSVANFLTGQGVNPRRVMAYGQGEAHPIASNDAESGRARNRRVELIITPVTDS